MKFHYQNVKSYEIKQRTFEGKTNPEKNDSALTSKYMPSYKYWLRINYNSFYSENCYRTKAACLEAVELAKRRAGNLL